MGECLSLNLAFDRGYREFGQKESRKLRGKNSFAKAIENAIILGESNILLSFAVYMG